MFNRIAVSRKSVTFSCGKYAKMANGAAVAQSGETAVMVTAVSKDSPSSHDSFMPLNVEFRMKAAAAGRIPTNYLRRELGHSEREILTARLTDRSIRPLFPKNYFSEVQIISNMLSADGINDPEILCINAASMALSLSDIPWNGPVAAVRIGMVGDDLVINPTRQELQDSSMNLVVTGFKSKVVMIEGSFNDLNANVVMHSIKTGLKEIQKVITVMQELTEKCGKVKQESPEGVIHQELLAYLESHYLEDLKQILTDFSLNKQSRDQAVSSLRQNIINEMKSKGVIPDDTNIRKVFSIFLQDTFRNLIFETDIR